MASVGESLYSLNIECCVRGYHVYSKIWNPTLGEVLTAVRERDNEHDRYAVATLEEALLQRIGIGESLFIKKLVIFPLAIGGFSSNWRVD